ncbi:MAG: type II secretion system F family protein, partial [Candidatus Omnitrophica bacterium]|nr:type II secretion system F family protein [Candidatus Omnitrophota bacterium]
NMVRAGEASGALDEILDRLASYMEKSVSMTRKVKSSMTYPVVVMSMALLITLGLILKVIPTFKDVFSSLGGQLPVPTQILISFSDFLRGNILWVGGVLFGIGFVIQRWSKTVGGKRVLDRQALKLPVIGDLLRKVAVARFARTLATLIRSGVPILNALEIVGKTAGNVVIEEAVEDVRANIREGANMAEPLAKSGVFPPMVVRMISVGERTGALESMLGKVADFYEEQVDAAVSAMTSLIEPLIIAFLGIVIGGIVIAMFLPIFKLTQVISA